MSVKIVVLGAGVVGLSTALNIQNNIPNARVEVIADHFYEDTTSYGSGGLFIPRAESGTDVDKIRKWCADSWKFYSSLATGPDAGNCGAFISRGYQLCNDNLESYQNALYEEFVYEYERMSDKEMENLGFKPQYKYGFKVTNIILDQRKYLIWLKQRLRDSGGQFEKRKVTSLNEFKDKCDILINCCGLGSRELFGDKLLFPVRGEIVRVKAPWIKYWVNTDDVTYMIPGVNDIALGGLRQNGKESLNVDSKETEDILQRCRKLIPSLKEAKVDHTWIGLRPYRERVRLEKETFNFGNWTLEVIHNYGHGSHGVALSWGTSLEVVDLVKQCLRQRNKMMSKL